MLLMTEKKRKEERISLSYKIKDEDKKDGIARQDEKKPPPIVKGWCEKKGVGSDPLCMHDLVLFNPYLDYSIRPAICL